MENHMAGAALVAWLLLAPLVGVFVSAGWGGRRGTVHEHDERR